MKIKLYVLFNMIYTLKVMLSFEWSVSLQVLLVNVAKRWKGEKKFNFNDEIELILIIWIVLVKKKSLKKVS